MWLRDDSQSVSERVGPDDDYRDYYSRGRSSIIIPRDGSLAFAFGTLIGEQPRAAITDT